MSKFTGRWWLFVVALLLSLQVFAGQSAALDVVALRDLPADARATLALIKQGGPYPFAKDGVIFGNYEKILPHRERGYYHEFTVASVGARNRGGRRIISGGRPPVTVEYFYTDDHYASFRRIQE